MDPPVYTLSSDLRKEICDAFALCDLENTGYIQSRDLGVVMRALGQNPTESEIYSQVEELDEEHTGLIAFDDFLEMMTKLFQIFDREDVIRAAFASFDTDKIGYISHADMRNVFTNMGEKVTDQEFDDIFREIDIDGDGVISWRDFYLAFKN